jgi:hypothetical protein
MIEPDARTLVAANGADFRIGGARAFYSPSGDFVRVPPPQAYFEPINWHRTAFHELGHYAEVRIMPHGAMECAIMPVIYHAVFGIISAFPGTRATDRPAGSGLARLRRLAPCSKSAAIWGTAAVALTHSGRQPVTHRRTRQCGGLDFQVDLHLDLFDIPTECDVRQHLRPSKGMCGGEDRCLGALAPESDGCLPLAYHQAPIYDRVSLRSLH